MCENTSNNSHTFKLVLVGDSGVGKTCLVERAVRNSFNHNVESTIGAAFQTYKLPVEEQTVTFNIWDTAGQERYRSLAPIYYRGSHAAIVVYDITNNETFANIESWIYNIKSVLGSDILIALVGNKCDLEHRRDVDYKLAKKFANKNSLIFAEASAKTASNIALIFYAISKELLKINFKQEVKGFRVSDKIDKTDTENKKISKKRKCC